MASVKMNETEVKTAIRGILTSNPRVSTMQSVRKEYKELIGEEIPFIRLQYNSLEHFLKSIPDVCTVSGSGPFAQVFPVITEKIAHINKMVTQQKVPSKRKVMYPRRNIRTPVSNMNFRRPNNSYNYAFSPNNSGSSGSYGSMDEKSHINLRPTNISNKAMQNVTTPNTNPPPQSHNAKPQNIPVYPSAPNKAVNLNMQIKNTNTTNATPPNHVKLKLDNLIEQQMKPGNVSQPSVTSVAQLTRNNVEKWINSHNNQIPDNAPVETSKGIEINRSNSPQPKPNTSVSKDDLFEKSKEKLSNLCFDRVKENVEEDTSNVSKRVQCNLKTLISQFADGIWSSDLPEHYRKLFKKDLSFMEYGYTSLIEMCIALKHIFHYVRPGKDDFKLYDRSKPLPPSVEKMYTIASYDIGKKISQNQALPELDWADFKGHIPDDVFAYGKEIANQFIPDGSKEHTVLDVVVVEIYDPSKFWFYLGTSQTRAILDDLMDEIQTFYNQPENAKEYAIPPGALKEGLYCVQIIYGEYHRARIVRLLADEYVRVLYIDYGTVCKAPIKGMCFLHSNFSVIPAQAIRCRLANIIPKEKGHPWPRSTSDRFRELVNRRDTKIKISHVEWGEEFVCVFLADVTDSKNITYINEVLVKEGHALWDGETQVIPFVLSNFKCKVHDIHLFPTFLELEYGLAPNASEMYSLQEMLVPLQFCIPQYFERDEQVLSDDESDYEELENSFIETVKNHRKFTPWSNVDLGFVTNSPMIDFDVFGDFKDEMIEFCNRVHLVEGEKVQKGPSGQDEESSSKSTDESRNRCQSALRNIEDFEPDQLPNQDQELSESIINKLENYSILNSEPSTSPDSDTDHIDDFLTCLVPEESRIAQLDPCGKKITPDDIMDQLLSTILEQSEDELNLSVAGSSVKAASEFSLESEIIESSVNIFDNPEAFLDTSEESDCNSPVTPESFLRTVENKLLKSTHLDMESDGLHYVTSNRIAANLFSNFKCEEPTQDLIDFYAATQAKDSTVFKISTDCDSIITDDNPFKQISDNIPEALSVRSQDEGTSATGNFVDDTMEQQNSQSEVVDLSFESSLVKTRNDFIASLSETNPFRSYLRDNGDQGSSINVTNVQSEKNMTQLASEEVSRYSTTQTEFVSLKESEAQTFSDPDASDYKDFVPKSSQHQLSNVASVKSKTNHDNLPCSTPLSFRNPATERFSASYTPPVVATPPRVNTPPRMSVHAAAFVPSCFQPQYPVWSNGGGYPVPQYPPWNNGTNYPPQYSTYPGPRSHVRPPPGFTAPFQGPPGFYQSNQYMPHMGPPLYHAPFQPPQYYGPPRQMRTPPPGMPRGQDFYERFNEELLKRNSEKS